MTCMQCSGRLPEDRAEQVLRTGDRREGESRLQMSDTSKHQYSGWLDTGYWILETGDWRLTYTVEGQRKVAG